MASAIGTGKRLKGRYRLERTLGRGGMAAVWLGHDEVLDRPVAVKVLSDTIASDPDFVARFRREARTAAGLSHPNFVGVYDFAEEGERPYLVMQFVPGEDLAMLVARGERIDCEKLARELLDALAHIHEVGILHRDVKPANIIIEPDDTAKLIDFGIALPRDATSLTSTGLVLGTERYAAPEVMEGRPATERSDLYSCGVVLRSCAGRRSPAFSALIDSMLSRDPADRPLSAHHALARLEQPHAPVDEPTQVLARQSPPPVWRRDPAAPSGRRAAAAAALGLVAAVVIVALVALSGGEERAPSGGQQAAPANKAKGEGSQTERGGRAAGNEAPVTTEASVPTAEGEDPALGAALNEQGFALIQAGEYEAAVPVLEEAVSAFPEGTEDLNYAYALFNLGNALRLSGRAEEAIPILERRLEFPNQTGEVRRELEAARAEAD
ncbi:MAG TPA: serine/threonine-protein kinase [Solirubrobacterales bacterium]|nr:serine/threonine-protein kinase [Solirubrobacterales bacterium]